MSQRDLDRSPLCCEVSAEKSGVSAWRSLGWARSGQVDFCQGGVCRGLCCRRGRHTHSMSLAASKASTANTDYEARVERVLNQTPLIDGHNDLPWEIRERFKSRLTAVDLKSDTSKLTSPPILPR